MTPPHPDGRESAARPSAFGILLVFLLVMAGAMTHYGAFKWHGLLLMLTGLGLAVAMHVKPFFDDHPLEPVLLGVLPAFLAAMAYMPAGQNERQIVYMVPGIGHKWQRVNNFGMAIHVLAAIGFLLALTYLFRQWKDRRWVLGRFIVLLAFAVAMRGLILLSSPNPRIDVMVSQTAGAKGLLLQLTPPAGLEAKARSMANGRNELWTLQNSRNVYSMVFPSPYWDDQRNGQRVDSTGALSVKPRYDLQTGEMVHYAWFDHYGYPPATIYANALGWWAFKDVRGAWLVMGPDRRGLPLCGCTAHAAPRRPLRRVADAGLSLHAAVAFRAGAVLDRAVGARRHGAVRRIADARQPPDLARVGSGVMVQQQAVHRHRGAAGPSPAPVPLAGLGDWGGVRLPARAALRPVGLARLAA